MRCSQGSVSDSCDVFLLIYLYHTVDCHYLPKVTCASHQLSLHQNIIICDLGCVGLVSPRCQPNVIYIVFLPDNYCLVIEYSSTLYSYNNMRVVTFTDPAKNLRGVGQVPARCQPSVGYAARQGFQSIGPLGRCFHKVAMSVYKYICLSPFHVIFF